MYARYVDIQSYVLFAICYWNTRGFWIIVLSEPDYFETLIRVHMSIVLRCKIDPLRRVQTSIETNIPSL